MHIKLCNDVIPKKSRSWSLRARPDPFQGERRQLHEGENPMDLGWENHRKTTKTIGKPWENGGLMGFIVGFTLWYGILTKLWKIHIFNGKH